MMNITQLIKELETMRIRYGELEIGVFDTEKGSFSKLVRPLEYLYAIECDDEFLGNRFIGIS